MLKSSHVPKTATSSSSSHIAAVWTVSRRYLCSHKPNYKRYLGVIIRGRRRWHLVLQNIDMPSAELASLHIFLPKNKRELCTVRVERGQIQSLSLSMLAVSQAKHLSLCESWHRVTFCSKCRVWNGSVRYRRMLFPFYLNPPRALLIQQVRQAFTVLFGESTCHSLSCFYN